MSLKKRSTNVDVPVVIEDLKTTIRSLELNQTHYNVFEYIKELSTEVIGMFESFNVRYRLEIHQLIKEMYGYGIVTSDVMKEYLRNKPKYSDGDVKFIRLLLDEQFDECNEVLKDKFINEYITDDEWDSLVREYFEEINGN